MEPTFAATTSTVTGPVHFLNIEYLFYELYQWVSGAHSLGGTGAVGFSWFAPLVTTIWVIITIIAFLMALGFLALLIYSTLRMYQIQDETAPRFATIADAHASEETRDHHRWNHVRELIESGEESDWRQAIIEADIMLDDLLSQLGYIGNTVGEKLKVVDPSKFHTLNEAWEAHKVRNEIAHQGSAFQLTDHIAYRTILHYENVFREHGEI
jgi:hypothetical protein